MEIRCNLFGLYLRVYLPLMLFLSPFFVQAQLKHLQVGNRNNPVADAGLCPLTTLFFKENRTFAEILPNRIPI